MTPTPSVGDLRSLRLAVVGHQEWVTFLDVDALPQPGCISRASRSLEEPAGAGAVVAVQLARLTGRPVLFFTALGRDAIGERSVQRLKELGVEPVVAWRDGPSRRGISFMDPWRRPGDHRDRRSAHAHGPRRTGLGTARRLRRGVRVRNRCSWTAAGASSQGADGDTQAALARAAGSLPATGCPDRQWPRPGEQLPPGCLEPPPSLQIATEGDAGGVLIPGGRFNAEPLPAPMVESYGCGDSFAAGVTAGLAAGWSVNDAVALGARCGAACATRFGPYG